MPLVLVENEVRIEGHDWKDVTGVVYHFPNQYRVRVQPGERFVYYKGVNRRDGGRRPAGYFGTGRIGNVWRDSEQPRGRQAAWYASILEYVPFQDLVPARREDGSYLETPAGGSGNMYFRNGVRLIDDETFENILRLADVPLTGELPGTTTSREDAPPHLPRIEDIRPMPAELPLLAQQPQRSDQMEAMIGGPRSRHAKLVGDRAEEIVFGHLCNAGLAVRWIAREGLKPGWDLEYKRKSETIRVEVKGSATAQIVPVELTPNEMDAARRYGADYHLYLVADCLSAEPRIQVVEDPAQRLVAVPASWCLWQPPAGQDLSAQ